jgi:hypothetical protein
MKHNRMQWNKFTKPLSTLGIHEYKITNQHKGSFFPQMRPEKVAGEGTHS